MPDFGIEPKERRFGTMAEQDAESIAVTGGRAEKLRYLHAYEAQFGNIRFTDAGIVFPDNSVLAAAPAASTSTDALGRNIVIGGDFTRNPWQRGVTFAAIANGAYGPDRYRVDYVTTAVVTVSQTLDAPTATEAEYFTRHCYRALVTTADAAIAAGDFFTIGHRVEGFNVVRFGFGQSTTAYLTRSLWVRAVKTGVYCLSFRNAAANRSYVTEINITSPNTWQKKTVTIPVDTTGTWLYDTGIGLDMRIALACGTTFQTVANAWMPGNYYATSAQVNALDAVNNDFRFCLDQAEIWSAATEFEWRSHGTELALCQRYFWKTFQQGVAPAQATGNYTGSFIYVASVGGAGTLQGGSAKLPVTMRAAPTITTYSPIAATANWYNVTALLASGVPITAPAGIASGEHIYLFNTQVATDAVGAFIALHATAASEL